MYASREKGNEVDADCFAKKLIPFSKLYKRISKKRQDNMHPRYLGCS